MEKIFWLDNFNGAAKGGCYLRNPLKEFIEKAEAQGEKIVGIKYDGTYNLEILMEEKSPKDDYADELFPDTEEGDR